MREEKLYQAFKMFDQDGSGKISSQELRAVLGSISILIILGNDMYKDSSNDVWDNLVKDADKDGDGEVFISINNIYKIYYNEFIEMMDKIKI